MIKAKSFIFLLAISLSVLNCSHNSEKTHHYENQIGDTPFNANLDNASFKFCDSSKVLHKRALISYKGGRKALKEELLKAYQFQPKYKTFNGYFVIRFAVNCYGETGRFRTQILDTNFEETKSPKALKSHILNITKELKGWNYAVYKGAPFDCYTFINIKIENGKILDI